MTEWKSMIPTSSSSQSSIAAMKTFLAYGRLRQDITSPANITTVVEMQSKPLSVCPIRLPFILFSILSFIILWYKGIKMSTVFQ